MGGVKSLTVTDQIVKIKDLTPGNPSEFTVKNDMNDKKNIPIKFIILNIVAVVIVITIIDIIEPAQGVFTIVFIGAFAVLVVTFSIISRLMEKSPLPIRAINDGLNQYFRYLLAAWLGWQCHTLYLEIEDPAFSKMFILITIALTCIFTICVNFKKHIKTHVKPEHS